MQTNSSNFTGKRSPAGAKHVLLDTSSQKDLKKMYATASGVRATQEALKKQIAPRSKFEHIASMSPSNQTLVARYAAS